MIFKIKEYYFDRNDHDFIQSLRTKRDKLLRRLASLGTGDEMD